VLRGGNAGGVLSAYGHARELDFPHHARPRGSRGVLGTIVAELILHSTQKLPFTCSYLSGKSNFNIAVLMCVILFLPAIMEAVKWERDSFDNPARYAVMIGVLAAFAFSARWSAMRLARSAEGKLAFEEAGEPAVLAL
jgi:hypothetical protein